MNFIERYVPIPEDVRRSMRAFSSVMLEEMVFALGSGDGRILITAAKDFHARGVGVEARMSLVRECRRKVREMGLSHQITIRWRNFKNVSLKKANVLAMFFSS